MSQNNIAMEIYRQETGDMSKGQYSCENVSFTKYLKLLEGRATDTTHSTKANSTVMLTTFKFIADPKEEGAMDNPDNYETVFSHATNKGEVKFRLLPNGFVIFDMIFYLGTDPELRLFANRLNAFGDDYTKFLESVDNGDMDDIPYAMISVQGDEFLGDSYLSLRNPVFWALTSEIAGDTNNNVLRVVFKLDDVEVIPIGADELDGIVDDIAYIKRNS